MKHRILTVIVILLCNLLLSTHIVPGNAAGKYNDIDSRISAAMKKHNIPGVALAFTRGEKVIYSQGYGTAGNGRTVTPDTPFYIGSQSKSFTALAIMQLVEQGVLDLDEPVQTYLPWFRVADEQASRQITIRHLLQHTGGLSESDYAPGLPPDATLEMLVRDLSRAHPTAPVGTRMQYFNPGYSTLGLIIETVSGQSYGDYIGEHIFTPLKMSYSFTDPEAAKAAGLAQGYAQVFMLALPLEQPVSPYDLPAGFIISTANDMARYLMALNNGGELDGVRILKPENVQLMFTPNSAIKSTYGFGWFISQYHDETKITHGGDTERFHTSTLLLPEQELSLVLLINENHLFKGINDYDDLFWSVAGILTDHPPQVSRTSSIIYGWGLFALWIVILALAVRKVTKLPQWRVQMLSWNSARRRRDILQHLLWIAGTILVVVVIVPAFLHRGFSWRWFTGFLPDVAIIVGTLLLDDTVQVILKVGIMAKNKTA